MASARYIVGIDLGTTHTVVAYSEGEHARTPAIFAMPQLVSATEVAARAMLASALYAPFAGEAIADPWQESPYVVGEFAVRRGAQVPGRLVASAKSWLSHPAVDREAPILPWEAAIREPSNRNEASPAPRISPVEASAMFLRHVRHTWDATHPQAPLAEQDVVLTVPASFDPSARELTVAAARRAGLSVSLLEEPQAAFYDHLAHTETATWLALASAAGGEALVLVCDVGGGTTDLSLLRLTVTGEPASAGTARACATARIAVGRHLLLGGDNMDLALAHIFEARLAPAQLGPVQLSQVTLACREAKELLLRNDAPERAAVTLLASGSDLLGAARSAELTRDEVRALLLDGFFPRIAYGDATRRVRQGLLGLGLPYERDVAITAHVSAFLRRHAPEGRLPDALLLNGGVFRAAALRERLCEVVQSWSDTPLQLLTADAPDLAVARGAVAYGQARRGRGARIESRSPRGYYIGIDSPGAGSVRRLVSVLPRGAREDEVHRVTGRTFALTIGKAARFDLFASDEADDAPGQVIELDARFASLPPVSVRFDAPGSEAETAMVEVEGKLSPIGTLDLACVETGGEGRRFQLAFELRSSATTPAQNRDSHAPAGAPKPRETHAKRFSDASASIDLAFGKAGAEVGSRAAKDLVRELERVLGERASWTTEVARAIYDQLVRDPAARRRSVDHERVFWMLTGYTVRPGFGYPGDESRLMRAAPLFSEMLLHPAETRGWQQFWIAWRRMAPGLGEREQTAMRDLVDPFLAPTELRLKKRKGLRPLAPDELLEMASHLERLDASRRADLGHWVVERTYTARDHRLFAALGRLGARVPTYASAHHVVAPQLAERWIDHLLRENWPMVPAAGEAALQIARLTGDRARDVAESVRAQVTKRWARAGFDEARSLTLREVVPVSEQESITRLGESLPVGLRLIA